MIFLIVAVYVLIAFLAYGIMSERFLPIQSTFAVISSIFWPIALFGYIELLVIFRIVRWIFLPLVNVGKWASPKLPRL